MNNLVDFIRKKVKDSTGFNFIIKERSESELSNFVKSIKEIFLLNIEDYDFENRFEIPKLFFQFIQKVSTLTQSADDQYPWKGFFNIEQIVVNLKSELQNADGKLDQIIIPIGYWSDKHFFYISCDRSKDFGSIYDAYDITIDQVKSHDIICDSFEEFIKIHFWNY